METSAFQESAISTARAGARILATQSYRLATLTIRQHLLVGVQAGRKEWQAKVNAAAARASSAPTIGGLAHHLATLRTTRGYEKFIGWGKRTLLRVVVVSDERLDTSDTVDRLMGNKPEARFTFIQERAAFATDLVDI